MKCLLLLALCAPGPVGLAPLRVQALPVDSRLVRREKLKWPALSRGEFSQHLGWLPADFMNIGYLPDGSVNRRRQGEQLLNPGRVPGKRMALRPASFALTDFHVLTAGPDVRRVPHIARGPLNRYANSTRAKQGAAWKTLFYRATAFQPAA